MNKLPHLTICFLFAFVADCFAQSGVMDRVNQFETRGQFKEATASLSKVLQNTDLSAAERKKLEFELDRLERIKKDYPYTKDSLFAELKKSVKDLTREEFDRWVAEGRFDSREIDGHRYFMTSSVSNLFFRYPELASRRTPPKETAELEKFRLDTCRAIKTAALAEKKPFVLPKRFHVTMTVTAKSKAAPASEIIHAWLPIPRHYPFQTDFQLLSTSSKAIDIQPEDSPIRSLYLEQPAGSDKTEFKVENNYTIYGVHFEINPADVREAPEDAALKPFVKEAPHIVFTPELRELSKQIAGNETNPYLKAKKFYDWIGDQIKYSYALEYSTIRNISDYCRTKKYGDCGQEALLFMALCRLNGIPARWQTGWNTCPGDKTIHDWCEIYLSPYGWMPVDPYMSIFAMRYANTLTPEQKREVRDFYFGSLDWYRMAANSDHNQNLTPPKKTMRSDDVDFQRGELEYGNHNIYFDQYSWALNWTEIKPDAKD
ncbi:MAG TPA: transglutaminase-like domain-containing protein [Candidatus Eisenbacteria bacterium]|nr:transglutaminase-like domain-containing protein [Candidatus Eisenbacteria bacterium]